MREGLPTQITNQTNRAKKRQWRKERKCPSTVTMPQTRVSTKISVNKMQKPRNEHLQHLTKK
jgi:hypothetical protein